MRNGWLVVTAVGMTLLCMSDLAHSSRARSGSASVKGKVVFTETVKGGGQAFLILKKSGETAIPLAPSGPGKSSADTSSVNGPIVKSIGTTAGTSIEFDVTVPAGNYQGEVIVKYGPPECKPVPPESGMASSGCFPMKGDMICDELQVEAPSDTSFTWSCLFPAGEG